MVNRSVNLYRFRKELDSLKKELEGVPEGHLGRKNSAFYQVFKDNKQLGITKNPELVKGLCRKKYVLARIRHLEQNFSKSKVEFASSPPQELIASFSAAYQIVPLDYFYHPAVKEWAEKSPPKNHFYPEQAKYEGFRSMSERTIARILDSYGLLYHYDALVDLGHKRVSPDFIIKNPFTGETFVWEHFGAFNQEKYADAMNDKMDAYLDAGYRPFENLLYTFEWHLRDSQRIRDLVEQVIL